MTIINIFNIIQENKILNFKFNASDFTKIEQINSEDKIINVELIGEFRNENGVKNNLIHIKIYGDIDLICTSCSKALPYNINIENTIEIFGSQKKLDELLIEHEVYDTIVGSEEFNVKDLIEEEIILSVPAFPMHDICPEHDYKVTENKKISPFSVLEALKNN